MRIVLSTFGTRGDVQPFVALGLTLRARVHDLVMGAPETTSPSRGPRASR
jgi:UDP:flavonoid glycosyltransferase YjiC (YdhE family)